MAKGTFAKAMPHVFSEEGGLCAGIHLVVMIEPNDIEAVVNKQAYYSTVFIR